MKVDLKNIYMGHAPNYAKCTIGAEFQFDEKMMHNLPDETVNTIKKAEGELPKDLALKVAENGCGNFWLGKCLVQGGRECKG